MPFVLQFVAFLDAFCSGLVRLNYRVAMGFADNCWPGEIAVRRLMTMTAFGFGFYYLWYNTDLTVELVALGAMGVAVLLEFAAPD